MNLIPKVIAICLTLLPVFLTPTWNVLVGLIMLWVTILVIEIVEYERK